jgi:hypothetical protein
MMAGSRSATNVEAGFARLKIRASGLRGVREPMAHCGDGFAASGADILIAAVPKNSE